ncbi:MAG: hypothetical protein KKG53_06030, partial [Proteobacteria bacterium]|nr:hypothetical protein [Pseudomonadota bacterium]
PDVQVWILVLTVQSIPYLAAVVMSFISGFVKLPKRIMRSMTELPDAVAVAGKTVADPDEASSC